MGYPRSILVDRENGGFYHVTSRCVRRAWLCGFDPVSGRSFEHRRQWIEDRILFLAEIFAAKIYGYAVMDNHYHIVLHVDPHGVGMWTDQEVARRWVALTPPKRKGEIDLDKIEARIAALMEDAERLSVCRRRLGDLSWFMRFLNETIARRANREDECKGRFWEGRFECQVLLDERAVLGCMAYVDLNPIRAGKATSLEASEHTSVRERIERIRRKPELLESALSLSPLAGDRARPPRLEITELEYLELLDWSGRSFREGKRGRIPPDKPSVLNRLEDQAGSAWMDMIGAYAKRRQRAFGALSAVKMHARELKARWRALCQQKIAP
jgi:hypothetical protein